MRNHSNGLLKCISYLSRIAVNWMEFTYETNDKDLYRERETYYACLFLAFLLLRKFCRRQMKILQSPHIKEDLDYEQNLKERPITKSKKFKLIISDIGENLFLIIVSIIPIIFYPALYHAIDKEYDVIHGIITNPDIMLLTIPYIMHCILWVSSRDDVRWKKFTVCWNLIVVIVSILVYFLLKLHSIDKDSIRITTIWVFFGVTIISGFFGSTRIS